MAANKLSSGTNALLVALLCAGILAIINAFSYTHFTRIDLTENNRYTISPSTRQILAELDDIVNIKVYLSRKLPPYLVTITSQVRDLLEEYRIYADGNLAIEYIDPADDPATQQKLRFMGIPQLQLNIIEKDQAAVTNVYMGLAVLYGDSKEIIPALTDMATLEYELTAKILRVATDEVQSIGFLSGHGGPQLTGELGTINNLLREQYFTREVAVGTGDPIPDDIAALVVAGPRTLDNRDLFEIDQFIMRGGRVLFLVDAVDVQLRGLTARPLDNPLAGLLAHYGVSVRPELVLDRLNANASFQSGMFNVMIPYPFWVQVVRQHIDADHPIINNIESLVLPWPSPLSIDAARTKALEVTVLAQSSPYAWTQRDYFNLNPQQEFHPQPDQIGTRALAVALSGTFDSFFANQAVPPVSQPETDAGAATTPAGADNRTVIARSPDTRLVVVGNSRFVTGQFPEQYEGNRSFVQNIVDWFVIGDKLMTIRSREAGERPLAIVPEHLKNVIRYTNLLAVPALLTLFGLLQYLLRRRRKRRAMAG